MMIGLVGTGKLHLDQGLAISTDHNVNAGLCCRPGGKLVFIHYHTVLSVFFGYDFYVF